jgi:hypothetical protein
MNRYLSATPALLRPPRCVTALALLLSASVLAAPLPAQAAETPPAAPTPASTSKMDLRVPRITELYTTEQLHQMLAGTFADIEEVQVEGSREPLPPVTPEVWRGLFAPIWAMLNPSQAWRIFAPLPPDQTRGANEPIDATSGYLEPAAIPPPR